MAPWWLRSQEDSSPADHGKDDEKKSSASDEASDAAASMIPAPQTPSEAEAPKVTETPEKTAEDKVEATAETTAEEPAEEPAEEKPRKRKRRRRRRRRSADEGSSGDAGVDDAEEGTARVEAETGSPDRAPEQRSEPAASVPTEKATAKDEPTDAAPKIEPGPGIAQPEADAGADGVQRKIAVFVDFESTNRAAREAGSGNFGVDRVLASLGEKGRVVVRRAYADWHRHGDAKPQLHEAVFDLIDVPAGGASGVDGAVLEISVDAMDLCHAKAHIDTFVLVSGNRAFSALVSKLMENDKWVVGLGTRKASSRRLVEQCDEFLFYEEIPAPK